MLYLDKQIKSSNAYIISIFFIIWISNTFVWSVQQHPVCGSSRVKSNSEVGFCKISWNVPLLGRHTVTLTAQEKHQYKKVSDANVNFFPLLLSCREMKLFFCFALITWFIELVRQTSKVHWVNDVISCQFLCFVNIKRGHLNSSPWGSFSSREIVYLSHEI